MDDTRIRIDFPGATPTPVIAVLDESDDSLIVQSPVLTPRRRYGAPSQSDGAGAYRRAGEDELAKRQEMAEDLQKQRKAMHEMGMIATAWETFAVDHNTYSTGAALAPGGEISFAALKSCRA